MKCIICLKEKQPSDEHIIPDSIGGNIHIRQVCSECNSMLNKTIDMPFSDCDLVRFFRSFHKIGGKRGVVQQFFAGEVVDANSGKKMLLDDSLRPYTIHEVKIERDGEGKETVSFCCDVSDRQRAKQIFERQLRKQLKNAHPELQEKQINTVIARTIEDFNNEQSVAENVTVRKQTCVKFDDLLFEFIKIAYEIWFRKFGYAWVEKSSTAETIRDSLYNNGARSRIRSRLYCSIPFSLPFDDPSNSHLIILANGICYLRIFNVTCAVECEITNDEFKFRHDDSLVILNNFASGSVIERPLREMLAYGPTTLTKEET
jgi:hypothetical protein